MRVRPRLAVLLLATLLALAPIAAAQGNGGNGTDPVVDDNDQTGQDQPAGGGGEDTGPDGPNTPADDPGIGGGNDAGPDSAEIPAEAGPEVAGFDFGGWILVIIGSLIVVGFLAFTWVRRGYRP